MAEGGGKSFGACLQNILGELGKAEAYPDADPNIIQGIREMVVPAVQQHMAAQDPMAQLQSMMAPQGPEAAGMPSGPQEMAQAPTRLPRTRSNPLEQGVALERALSPEMAS